MSPPNVPFIRTSESRFQNLPDFPYEPKYLQYGNLRIAYIDEQVGSGTDVFLCFHGQPTWSYLYRKMIPVLLNHSTLPSTPSRRIIAPDLLGFGRSDKPTRETTYTFNFHRAALLHFICALNLRNITIVVQDWGGILGLTLPIAEPARFTRLLVMNTTLGTGEAPTPGFTAWRAFSNRNPDMKIGELMKRSCAHLSTAESAAYEAPFPTADFKAGVRRFPNLVMTEPEMEGVDVSLRSAAFYGGVESPFKAEDVFMACGVQDPVLGRPVMEKLVRVWRDGCYYAEVREGGHFVQEWGEEVARLAIEVYEKKGRVEGVRRIDPRRASI